jgi:hypothetical protein
MTRRSLGFMLSLIAVTCSLPVATVAQQSAGAASPITTSTTSAVPKIVNYSGTLIDLNGKPLGGVTGVTFFLYKEAQGGAPLWMETQNVHPSKDGRYTVTLGSMTSNGLPADVFVSGEARWLGVQVQGQSEQSRVLLVAVPYALKSGDAETLGGLPASAFLLATAAAAAPASATAGSALSSSVPPPATVTGSGTADYIPLWTGTTALTNSVLFQTGSGSAAKIGINSTTPAATLDVAGGATIRGLLNLPNAATATASAGADSRPFGLVASVFNSSSKVAVNQVFHWQAEPVNNNTASPSATLNLLFAVAPATAAETGLRINNKGQITFASGQTFPGTGPGTVTSVATGTGLTGGPIIGSGTLSIDTSVVPRLGVSNAFTTTNSIAANSSSPALTLANAGSGEGLDVTIAGSTYGIRSSSPYLGVYAIGGTYGSYSQATSYGVAGFGGYGSYFGGSGAYGTYSFTSDNCNYCAGSLGLSEGSSAKTLGVAGYTDSTAGSGVYGENVNQSSTGSSMATGAGVWGDGGTSGSSYGMLATADNLNAIYAQNNSSVWSTIWAYSANSSGFPFDAEGPGGYCYTTSAGNLVCTGTKSAVVPVENPSRNVLLYAVEAPQNWFEDAGAGQLAAGVAVVRLEPVFAQTVNTSTDYHVFLTPNGDCKGLYVTEKTPTSFVVRELGGGKSSISFDYRIMAKRKGYEDVRLAVATGPSKKRVQLTTPLRAPDAKRVPIPVPSAHSIAQLQSPETRK